MEDCCQKRNSKDFLSGILAGILPHSFCIGFVVFTLIGSTIASTFLRKFLITPYFFQILIGLSFVFAAISAIIYLKKIGCLSLEGVKKKWGYLSILFGTAIAVNLLLFLVVFPLAANSNGMGGKGITSGTQKISLEVKIPCSGHAPLVGDELKKTIGVTDFRFSLPNVFRIEYNPKQISSDQILNLPIFNSFEATVIENG